MSYDDDLDERTKVGSIIGAVLLIILLISIFTSCVTASIVKDKIRPRTDVVLPQGHEYAMHTYIRGELWVVVYVEQTDTFYPKKASTRSIIDRKK